MTIFGTKETKVNDLANRRKPRMYANIPQYSLEKPIPLDFCIWLQTNFDEAIEMNEQMKNCQHEFFPQFGNAPLPTFVCRCGAIRSDLVPVM